MEPSTALRWSLAGLALAAAAYHLWHAACGRRPRQPGLDVDLVHAGMGGAMAVMFVGRLNRTATLCLVGVFAAGTFWFLVRATAAYIDAGVAAAGDRTRQSLCCVVMTGMLAVTVAVRSTPATANMTGMSGMAGMSGPSTSGLPMDPRAMLGVLLALQAVVVVWTAGGRARALASHPAHRYSQLATGVSGACMLAMML